MSRQSDRDELGPLPHADRNSELQRLSISAFNRALPADTFIFRDERAEDFGVDGELELLVNGHATNLRAKVQLKATDSTETNSDGSISLSIAPSNLNYLLNGSCPLYVLYIHNRNELRFLWAAEEYQRITTANPQWATQGTVTLRFERLLTVETLGEIGDKIRREGRFRRQTLEILARAAAASPDIPITVTFNTATLAATDPETMRTTLSEMGMAMVAVGRGAEVLKLFDNIAPAAASTAHLLAVRAYANFSLGRYHMAKAGVSEALLLAAQGDPLEQDVRQHLLYIKLACEYQSGATTTADYVKAVKVWEGVGEQEGSWFVLSHKLNALRYSYLEERGEERRKELLAELKDVVRQVEELPGASTRFLINARLTLLYIEGSALVNDYFRVWSSVSLSAMMGFPPDADRLPTFVNERILPWETQIGAVVESARVNGNSLTYADALLSRASIRLPQVATTAIAHRLEPRRRGGATFADVSASAIQELEEQIERAKVLFHEAGSLEGELHAQALLADLLVLSGRTEEAKDHARSLLPQAEAMEYTNLIQRAREHLAGHSPFQLPDPDWQEGLEDSDVTAANMTDEKIRELADYLVRVVHRLPLERVPIAERDLLFHRRAAQERLHFCRHFELLQNLTHTKHPSTHLRTDPGRVCRCTLYGIQSAFEDPDGNVQIERFKGAACAGCKSREPKQE